MTRITSIPCLVCLAAAGAAACAEPTENDLTCGPGTIESAGQCVPDDPLACAPGTAEVDGACVPDGSVICAQGTVYDAATGACEVDATACGEGTVLVGGECVPFDDTLVADVDEAPEPNDAAGAPATFALPAIGDPAVTLGGCIAPSDADGDGALDIDVDAFAFEADGPALLDVAIDGIGGASAAFAVAPEDERLVDEGWLRIGASLVSDGARRRLFVPRAGRYRVDVTDARSLLLGLPAGGAGACYVAQVSRLPVPAADDLPAELALGGELGDPQFHRFAGDGGATVEYAELAVDHPGVRGGLVVMIDGQHAGSAAAGDDGRASPMIPGHAAGADIVLVVDAVQDLALDAASFDLAVVDLGVLAEPGDGTPVAITHSEAAPAVQLYFPASAGDLVRVQFDPGSVDYSVLVVPPSFAEFIGDLCFGCTAPVDAWIATQESGFHFFNVWNMEAADGESYQVAFVRTHVTPRPIAAGDTFAADLAGADRAWFELGVSAGQTLTFRVDPTAGAGFDGADLRFYDRAGHGQIDAAAGGWTAGVPALETVVAAGGAAVTRSFGADAQLLISVGDASGHDGDEAFDLTVY
jgi:hypothetical protein